MVVQIHYGHNGFYYEIQTDFSSIQNQSEIDIYTHANEVVLNSICKWLSKVTRRSKKP